MTKNVTTSTNTSTAPFQWIIDAFYAAYKQPNVNFQTSEKYSGQVAENLNADNLSAFEVKAGSYTVKLFDSATVIKTTDYSAAENDMRKNNIHAVDPRINGRYFAYQGFSVTDSNGDTTTYVEDYTQAQHYNSTNFTPKRRLITADGAVHELNQEEKVVATFGQNKSEVTFGSSDYFKALKASKKEVVAIK